MIKLAAMLLFVVVGAVIGSLFFRLTSRLQEPHTLTLPLCILLGVVGAFAGMLLGDLADIRLIGNLVDGLLFSAIGSALLLGLSHLLRRKTGDKN